MGLEEQNRLDDTLGQLQFFSSIKPEHIRVAIDPESTRIVGLMVLVEHELEQLYVHVDYQKSGIGSRFLTDARRRSPECIELYTFQKNRIAQKFYLRHGFTEIARGYADPAHNPWADDRQQLADIRYRWVP